MTNPIIQIVPVRANAPEGVGDYARLIGERLLLDHDLRTIFVAGSPLQAADRACDTWETHELVRRRARDLRDTLASIAPDTPIILHLSAYGYDPKGIPFWLLSAMTQWRRRHPHIPLITVFHELFATGPIWRSAFWLGPLQAHIARRMQEISTAGITTTEPYAALMRHWRGDRPKATVALPVFSTIGESTDIVRAGSRARTLAIFARGGEIYRNNLPLIAAFVVAQGIVEIIDIGSRNEPPPERIGGVPVRSLGRLPSDQLQAELSAALFGMLDYDADRLAKSTIFAAYAANGAIPVCLGLAAGRNDGLVPDGNYLRFAESDMIAPVTIQGLESMQGMTADWYRSHSLARTTDLIRAMLADTYAAGERD